MKDSFTVELVGMDEVQANLDKLTATIRDKLLKTGLRKAGQPILSAMRAKAPVDLGYFRDNLIMVVKSKGTRGSFARAVLGVKTNVRLPVRLVRRGRNKGQMRLAIPTRYAHLIEFGHDVVVNGKVVGRVRPNPVFRSAWQNQGGEAALYRFEEYMSKAVQEEVAKIKP